MPDLNIQFREAARKDAAVLARLNQALIRDEGHRNPMSLPELEQRMARWLQGEYRAVLFEVANEVVGYAVYREEPDHVYLRQFFVSPEWRRHGAGRAALAWLKANAWAEATRLRLDVLLNNPAGIAFWRVMGFRDYCLTMEQEL